MPLQRERGGLVRSVERAGDVVERAGEVRRWGAQRNRACRVHAGSAQSPVQPRSLLRGPVSCTDTAMTSPLGHLTGMFMLKS